MYWSHHSAVDAASFTAEWAPRLLHFFQLILGDQALSESLTIETLVEEARRSPKRPSGEFPLGLARRALKHAIDTPDPRTNSQDQIVRAVRSLPRPERTVVALFRGLGLSLEEVAAVAGADLPEVKRLCANGLLAIHRSLTSLAPAGEARNETGEF